MGFLSKVWKKVKKVVKGIGKAVKKFAGKVFGSTFGKVLLGAIAIYTGGMALGIFNGPAAIMGAAPGATLKQRFLTKAFQRSLTAAGGAGKTGVSKVLKAVMDTAGSTVKGYLGMGEKTVEQSVMQSSPDLAGNMTGDIFGTGPDIVTSGESAAGDVIGQASFDASGKMMTGEQVAEKNMLKFKPPSVTETLTQKGAEQAVRTLSPPWGKNSNFMFTDINEDGLLEHYDLSYVDPYNYWKRPITAIKKSIWSRTLEGINNNKMAFYVGANFLSSALDDSVERAEDAFRDRWKGGDIGGAWEGAKYGQQHRRSQAVNIRRPTLSSLRRQAEEPAAVGY